MPRPTCIDLRARFGRRYRVAREESYRAERGAGARGKRLKGPKPIFGGACRDCGLFRATARNEWRLATPPRCHACGGMLDRAWRPAKGGRRDGGKHDHERIDE